MAFSATFNPSQFRMNGIVPGWSSMDMTLETADGKDTFVTSEALAFLMSLCRGIDYTDGKETALIYAKGPVARAHGVGNLDTSGTMTFLADAEALLAEMGSKWGSLEQMPTFTLVCEFKYPALLEGATANDFMKAGATKKTFSGVRFGARSSAMQQGSTANEISVPFSCAPGWKNDAKGLTFDTVTFA